MAVRGVYSKAEEKMLERLNNSPFMKPGWFKPVTKMEATAESIKKTAVSVDYWNPLWRDDNYAMGTRWGGIIAPPMFSERFGYSGSFGLEGPPEEVGYQTGVYIGQDYEFFKPVRPGDSFTVWRNPPKLEDITSSNSKELRRFTWMPHDLSLYNQHGDLVNTLKTYLECAFYPEQVESINMPKTVHKYTKEELEFIDHTIDEEEIRGAEIRYWEDVEIGDETRPVIMGPTTTWDMIYYSKGVMAGDFPPLRDMRRAGGGMLLLDPETNVSYMGVEYHFTEKAGKLAGLPHGFHFGNFAATLMVRCVTNWMGDDGFLRKYKWRHLTQTPIGDTVIGHGKVINKYIENDEHLVDLDVYLENIRGNITEAANATVLLYSKKGPYAMK
ncbi:MAG: MaoC family dehydratase N-terminal domain-containing protein [Candidatus Hodarchaeota archaeon]